MRNEKGWRAFVTARKTSRARETRDAALKAEAAAKAAAGDAPQLPAMQNISSDQAPTAQPATTGAGANSSMMALAARAAAEAREAEAEAEGGTIHDFSCLSEREVRRLMRQMGEAILHCHRLNIVHRDIKPENLLVRHALAAPTPGKAAGMGLSQFAAPIELVIADFGLAQRLQSKKISIVNFCGTVAFMAPEMLVSSTLCTSMPRWTNPARFSTNITVIPHPFPPRHRVLLPSDIVRMVAQWTCGRWAW